MAIDVDTLYRNYGPMVLRRCRGMLKDEDAALDAMQETFVLLLRKQEQLTEEAPSSMLYTFATNVCLNQLRRRKRGPALLEPEIIEAQAAHDGNQAQVEERHFLDRIFAAEPASTRDIVYLHYQEKHTLQETAKRVGLSVSGVRRRLRFLRQRSLALREL